MSDVLNEAPKAVSKYDQLIAAAREVEPPRTVVVHPCDETSLRGAVEAAEAGLIEPVLVGPAAKIRAVATQHRIDLDGCEIVDAAAQPRRRGARGGAGARGQGRAPDEGQPSHRRVDEAR